MTCYFDCTIDPRYDCLILNSYIPFGMHVSMDIIIIADVINSLSYSFAVLCAWTWKEFVTHSVHQLFGIECSETPMLSRSLQKIQTAIFNLSECHKFSRWLNNGFCLRLEFVRASIYNIFSGKSQVFASKICLIYIERNFQRHYFNILRVVVYIQHVCTQIKWPSLGMLRFIWNFGRDTFNGFYY